MATFLDAASVEGLSIVFVFLFVFLFIYAILLYTRILGQNQLINSLIAVVAGFFVILSDLATLVVKQVSPLFAVVLVFVAIISVASRSIGVTAGTDALPAVKWLVLVVMVIALVVGTLSVVRENIEVPETGEDFSKSSTVLFHPNFLGIVLITLVAVFTVGLLAAKQM
ncbi:hypothetical protein CMO93_01135 [Candidatus Woesearchaeota archaeon]|nr:hypothetical protein [Candidatus Woesearchaeota archaeon]|tara:strand:+ start:1495 stop:1998 length:504 start_codon:yes stop_codon:yes gene_type:complete